MSMRTVSGPATGHQGWWPLSSRSSLPRVAIATLVLTGCQAAEWVNSGRSAYWEISVVALNFSTSGQDGAPRISILVYGTHRMARPNKKGSDRAAILKRGEQKLLFWLFQGKASILAMRQAAILNQLRFVRWPTAGGLQLLRLTELGPPCRRVGG